MLFWCFVNLGGYKQIIPAERVEITGEGVIDGQNVWRLKTVDERTAYASHAKPRLLDAEGADAF